MNKPILEIVAVTYGHDFKLKCFIDSIRSQTNPNWCLHIIHDGVGEIFDNLKQDLSSNGYLDDSRIVLSATKARSNNWGHPLRQHGLKNRISSAPYIVITNSDNYYVPIWVSEINTALGQDLIYWDCVHSHENPRFDRSCGYGLLNAKLEFAWIDMGCVAIKSNIVTKVGFPFTSFAADWEYFESCLKHISPNKIKKINKILFVHN